MTNPLDTLAHLPRWVGWRNEQRNGKATKVPFDPASGHRAKADDPTTWRTAEAARAWAARHVNGQGGGIGIELGDLGDGAVLAGVDLDTCRANDGTIASWAREVIEAVGSYCEVSPSRTGVKLFFTIDAAALPAVRAAMGTAHGKAWKRGQGEHPPAIELHVGNRYFAVTGEVVDGTPAELRPVGADVLLHLIRATGPAFAGAGKPMPPAPKASPDDGGLAARIEAAAAYDTRLARRWRGDFEGVQDGSGSGQAMAIGAALKAAGFGFGDVCAALRDHPATADWARAKGDVGGGRELRRLFDVAGAGATHADDGGPPIDAELRANPDMGVLRLHRRPPPELPLAVFGGAWGEWIKGTAEAAACPPDYVAGTLLAVASALIGNARWAEASPGWREPPHLWTCAVGDSGGGKSPGADTLFRDVLPVIEQRMGADFPEQRREWQARREAANARHAAWQNDVKTAQKMGNAPPMPPADDLPPEPQTPRVRVNDVTIERVATLLAHAAPKGLLIHRDELLGWISGMNNYHEAGRAFWIEAYGGRPYRVERQKNPDPIDVARLALAVFGGTQPARLAGAFRDADDGLLARVAWFWPDPVPFRIGDAAHAPDWAIEALDRLRLLDLAPAEAGMAGRPIFVPLADDLRPVMEDFGRDIQARQAAAGGLMCSACGKARGLALRLGLVLAYLRWCGEPGMAPPPTCIDRKAFLAATHLVADYLMPMAERVYGDAATRQQDRDAATLARWIARTRPGEVHVRTLQREVRLPGLGTAEAIHAAAGALTEVGWLLPPDGHVGFQRRPRAAYPVNPRVHEVRP